MSDESDALFECVYQLERIATALEALVEWMKKEAES